MIVNSKTAATVIRFLTVGAISLATVIACEDGPLSDDNGNKHERGETVVDNESINSEVFSLLSTDNGQMSAIVDRASGGELFYAAQDLLNYFRRRTSVVDPSISLIAPVITPAQQADADAALEAKTEELILRPQLEWMAAQGLAYRTSQNEKYARSWVSVMESFIANFKLEEWTVADACVRIDQLVSAWQYFLHSPSVTPAFASNVLTFIAQDAARLFPVMTEQENGPSVMGRVAYIFPEFAAAAQWRDAIRETENKGFSKEWFEVLNMDFPGLEAVKAAYQNNDYKAAAEAMLSYWKTRNSAVYAGFTYPSSISDTELNYANQALKENGYRFYVKNYYENPSTLLPYSYKAADGSINWQYWPTKDQEQRYQVNRHEWMPLQAKAYYVSKDEKYIKDWMEVYQDFHRQNPEPAVALNYSLYPENQEPAYRNAGWTWRPLEVAIRLMGECDIMELAHDSQSLTPEYLMWFLYEVQRQTDHVRRFYSNTGNHLITQAQGVAQIGFLFPELKESQEWISNGCGKLNNEVSAQYYPDGWLKDGDFHYHISSIEDFRQTMLLANANGKETMFPQAYRDAMKAMADVVVDMTFPNYSSVNMTDTRCETWNRSTLTKNFTRYSELFPDEQYYKWMATAGASGTVPSHLSAVFPDCGYYVLRSGWTASDMMMVLQNTTTSPNEQWHRQWDNNTFELYVAGRKFFQDSGCYTYTTGSNRNKYAATSAHNTLTLDGKNVTTCRGKMLSSVTVGNTDVLVLSNQSYSNLSHRRTVFFVDRRLFVIVDEAAGDAEGTVNLHFHLPPVEKAATDVTVDAASNSSWTSFSDGNNILVRTFSPSAMTTSERTGFLSTNIDKSVDRKAYQVDVTKTADQSAVRYITVILPCANPASETVGASFPEDYSANKVSASVTVGGKTYNLSTNL